MSENKIGAFTGAYFIVRFAYHVCKLWHPVRPPALGLHVVPLKFTALLIVVEAVASDMGAVIDVKWTVASFAVSWQSVQALPFW